MGFVGPNGAGKSTPMRILMGMIRQDRGAVRVLGHPIPARTGLAKRDIGFVSEDMRLHGNVDPRLAHEVRRLDLSGLGPAYADVLLRRFNLHADQDIKALSHGERVEGHAPPGSGAASTPAAARRAHDRSRSRGPARDPHRADGRSSRTSGAAILFSSHNTQDVEQISDQITFIDRGRIIDSSDKETFIDRWRRLHLDVPSGVTPGPAGRR